MGLTEDAIALQQSKRPQRLQDLTKAQRNEAKRQKFGTFIGRNLVDGTAIVLLDGDSNPTSGFRLISSGNVVKGDRVAVRKTEGLWRADALNVREVVVEQQVEAVVILREAVVDFIGFFFFSGVPLSGIASSFFSINYPPSIIYKYKNSRLSGLPEVSSIAVDVGGQNTEETDPPTFTPINAITSSIEASADNLIISTQLDQPFKVVSPSIGVNEPPRFFVTGYQILFDLAQWQDVFEKYTDYPDWINPSVTSAYTWASSPIEIESTVNGIPVAASFDVIFINGDENSITLSIGDDGFFPSVLSPTGTVFEVTIRYRKRGNVTWFDLS